MQWNRRGNCLKREPARIALLVDNPYRDLPGLVLVARYLCQQGATCLLVPMNLRHQEIWPLVPDMVVLNHFRTIYEDLVRQLDGAGILVAVLDTEGAIYSPKAKAALGDYGKSDDFQDATDGDLDEYACSMARDLELRQRVACYCAWTPRFARYAARKGWYQDTQIRVTGHPRMDLYAPQWHDFAKRISPHVETYANNLIIINSSFALANPRFQTPEKEVEMLTQRMAYDRSYVDEWLQAQQQAMHGLTRLAVALAHRFPDATFVYRPHPFEGEAVYREALSGLPNLHLVKKGTVDGWLLRAKAVIHWGSSTAIDACLAGIPAFTPAWLPTFPPVPAVEAVSVRCPSEHDLVSNIGHVLNGGFEVPCDVRRATTSVVENTFYKIDGRGHQRVAEALLDVVADQQPRPSKQKCRELAPKPANQSLRGRLSGGLKKVLNLPPDWSLRRWQRVPRVPRPLAWDSSDKYFDAAQVDAMIRAANESEVRDSAPFADQVQVMPAQDRGDYRFGYSDGRSVTVSSS